jgi:hypothetical protein
MYWGSVGSSGASTPKAFSSCWNVTNPTLCPSYDQLQGLGHKAMHATLLPGHRNVLRFSGILGSVHTKGF